MKKVYVSHGTEYERGWGQRPDGVLLSEDLESLKERIVRNEALGDSEEFTRYSSPQEMFVDAKVWAKLAKGSDTGIVWLGRLTGDFFVKAVE
jgi:hypothetical protein